MPPWAEADALRPQQMQSEHRRPRPLPTPLPLPRSAAPPALAAPTIGGFCTPTLKTLLADLTALTADARHIFYRARIIFNAKLRSCYLILNVAVGVPAVLMAARRQDGVRVHGRRAWGHVGVRPDPSSYLVGRRSFQNQGNGQQAEIVSLGSFTILFVKKSYRYRF